MNSEESSGNNTDIQDDDADIQNYIRGIVKNEVSSSISDSNNNNNNQQSSNTELGGLINQVNVLKGLKTAFESPFESAIIGQASERFMNQILPNMDAPPQQRSFMDSGFAMSIGNRLPDVLPALADVVFTRLGKEKTEQLIEGVQDKWLGGNSNSNTSSSVEGQNINEFINSLNPDDPADLHKYMQLRSLNDIDEARNLLIQEKQNLANQNVTAEQPQNNQNVDKVIADNNAALKELVSAIQDDRKIIEELSNKINVLENEKMNTDIVSVESEVIEESKVNFISGDDENEKSTNSDVKEAVVEEVDEDESTEYE